MNSHKRIVFKNGTDRKCKILGLDRNSVVVQGKHRKIHYNRDHVRTINYLTLDRFGFNPEMEGQI